MCEAVSAYSVLWFWLVWAGESGGRCLDCCCNHREIVVYRFVLLRKHGRSLHGFVSHTSTLARSHFGLPARSPDTSPACRPAVSLRANHAIDIHPALFICHMFSHGQHMTKKGHSVLHHGGPRLALRGDLHKRHDVPGRLPDRSAGRAHLHERGGSAVGVRRYRHVCTPGDGGVFTDRG